MIMKSKEDRNQQLLNKCRRLIQRAYREKKHLGKSEITLQTYWQGFADGLKKFEAFLNEG